MKIRVKVLYFGQAREAVGAGEEVLSVPSGTSVGEMMRISMDAHESLKGIARSLQVAVNEEMALGGDLLSEGDVVAVLPPVAGG